MCDYEQLSAFNKVTPDHINKVTSYETQFLLEKQLTRDHFNQNLGVFIHISSPFWKKL